ncbi:MAG: cysteine--tRNA ligase [Alphaproteobacteria bacterium]|nr:cysteine--tRNA ligase [Alphaproteobacteria bacterium]
MTLRLSNTLTRTVDTFTPIDPDHVKMYVCGPTVYARPHIGNARSVVVYDVLYRLLRHDFPQVTFVRNITDVDDKINAAAVARGISIQELTAEVTQQFHDDMGALNCLPPTVEPKATEHIAAMIALIERLIAGGFAYVAEGHVLFRVQKDAQYGCLSRRSVKDMVAGARVEIAPYKEYAGDFVLWKPAGEKDDASSKFDSPWGVGRPGWHIECSAMSATHLGTDFDIHGGGSDLMFPHHENEIAQSTCGNAGSHYAKYWVHNGFLTVNGEKMSKSLGNFITVRDLLDKGVKGEVIRFALLGTRYNEPLDWSDKLLSDAEKVVNRLYRAAGGAARGGTVHPGILDALRDNLNTPKALALLQTLDDESLKASANFLGFLQQTDEAWFRGDSSGEDTLWIELQIEARTSAKKARDFTQADAIREGLKARGIVLEDSASGTTWRRV